MKWNNLKSKNLSLESVFLIGIDILVGRWDNSLQDNPEEFIPQLSGAGLPASPAHRLSGGYNTNAAPWEPSNIARPSAKWYSGNIGQK